MDPQGRPASQTVFQEENDQYLRSIKQVIDGLGSSVMETIRKDGMPVGQNKFVGGVHTRAVGDHVIWVRIQVAHKTATVPGWMQKT